MRVAYNNKEHEQATPLQKLAYIEEKFCALKKILLLEESILVLIFAHLSLALLVMKFTDNSLSHLISHGLVKDL